MKSKILPRQKIGSATGAKEKIAAGSRSLAIKIFQEAKTRLMNVNQWQAISGAMSAKFILTDEKGNEINRLPKKGDLIKIELPAPGNEAGDGFDWVRIEEFEDRKNELKDEEIFGFRVRPVSNPFTDEHTEAHFYSSTATSTFLIMRSTNLVVAMEKGRNETINTGVKRLLNKIRNFLIAVGAMLGFAKPQWKGLVNGLLYGAPK